MSWSAYTDDQLVATGKVTHAAIIGLEGVQKGADWATSPEFGLQAAERSSVADIFVSPPDFPPGIKLADTKYLGLQFDGTTYLGRQGASILLRFSP